MQINKIVARFKNGNIMKGTTGDFFPNKALFHLQLATKEILEINIEELKSVFFVKDLEGNKDRKDEYTDDIPGGGRKVQVEFSDGEVLIGYTQGYSPTRNGFFVVPADIKNNNDRIYVIASATEKISFL